MSKLLITLPLLAILAACSSAGDRAKSEYEMAKRNGLPGDTQCAGLRKVAQAYLSDQDDANFKAWSLNAEITCMHEQTERETRLR